MARKKTDDSSSLELLLDTMCNTFGCVMFIGIALVVIIATLRPVQKESQIVTLSDELLNTLPLKNPIQSEHISKNLVINQIYDFLNHYIQIQKQLLIEKANTLLIQSQKEQLEKALSLCIQHQSNLTQQQDAQIVSIQSLQQQIELLKKELKKPRYQLNKVYRKSQAIPQNQSPYYYIISNNKIYRVGPTHPKDRNSCTNDVQLLPQPNDIFGITLQPNQGQSFITGDTLSPSLMRELQHLREQQRFPYFHVLEDSAEKASLLIEEVKSQMPYMIYPVKNVNEIKYQLKGEIKYQ